MTFYAHEYYPIRTLMLIPFFEFIIVNSGMPHPVNGPATVMI